MTTDLDFAGFQAKLPEAGFTDWLRARHRTSWEAMIDHRFTRDLAANQMPAAVFGRYLRYEHDFVRTAISLFGFALARAPSFSDQVHLIGVLHALATGQDGFFARAFRMMKIDVKALVADRLPLSATGLRDGSLAIAEQGSFEEIIAMMLAAEWMYLTWCRAAHGKIEAPLAAEWVAMHVDPTFTSQVDWLKRTINTRGPAMAPDDQENCVAVFGRMLNLEIAFHDAPYDA
ncbi:MAG: TenA family protein [Alphaproteobacteria bacterium]|nr:TenA family protein [Alphaproteobacteria bacterium]